MKNEKIYASIEKESKENKHGHSIFDYNHELYFYFIAIIKFMLFSTLALIFFGLFRNFVYADEYDSDEIAQIMKDTGAYDIIEKYKEEYPYYLFYDYSKLDSVGSPVPSGTNSRNYVLQLFSEKFDNGINYEPNHAYYIYWGYFENGKTANRMNYSYNGSSWSLDNGIWVSDKWSGNLQVLMGSNFNIYNSDGSYFFGLTSHSPILTSSAIKRTLLKPTVYLVAFVTVFLVLAVSFRKALIMLKTSLARV